jgi:hypothetical protein
MRWSRIIGFAGLCATMLLVLWLTTRSTTPRALDPATAASLSAAMPLGAAPPPDVARDPRAAKRYIEQQECLAACAMEARTCESTSEDVAGEAVCRTTREGCEARCREAPRP